MEIEKKTYNLILKLCKKGDDLAQKLNFKGAIELYNNALDLIPDPKTDWEASTWIYSALGDACFYQNDFKKACNYFFDATNCPDGYNNPFILLRIGQCQIEMGDLKKMKFSKMKMISILM
jgi:tetratricopeptide (TPR) repeat protein